MKKTIFTSLVIILSLLIFISCSFSTPIKSLKLNKDTLELEIEQTEKLNLIIEPAKASTGEIIWSVSDKDIATVDTTGLVKAISVGQCIITAKTKDEKFSTTCTVIVKPKSVKELRLDRSDVTLEAGSSATLNLSIDPPDAAIPEIQWTSSDDKIAIIDNKGAIKAISPGSASINAKTKDGVLSVVCNVTVTAKSVKSIKLNKTSLTLKEGSSEKLLATLDPPDATNQTINYSSNNPKIATVDSNGLVKAISQGKAEITATSADGGFLTKCIVTVNPKPVITQSSGSNPTSTHSSVLFAKRGGYMRVFIYRHIGFIDQIPYDSANLEIYSENNIIYVKLNDVGIAFDGDKPQYGLTESFGPGVGIDVKLQSTGEILYHRERTDP